MMVLALQQDPAFAEALAELPRVRKGYSDTALRGLRAYRLIRAQIVGPAKSAGFGADHADRLRAAIAAAMADDTHAALDAYLAHTGGGATA
jgi:indolepyruvate ferredoxin oxidoreductase, beta subunit